MSDDWKFLRRFVLCLAAAVVIGFVLLGLLAGFGIWTVEAGWALASGWATYPYKILPQVSYNVEMILCGLVALGLALYLAHRFLKWIAEHVKALPSPWSFKYTSCLSFLLLAMFGTSIAMTGIVHQTAWLATSGEIKRNRSASITTLQISDARSIASFAIYWGADNPGDRDTFPDSLTDLLEDEDFEQNNLLCRFSKGEREPWLYPGAGKPYGSEVFPLIISPRPNNTGRIVVAFSDMSVKAFSANELPPEISIFFE